MDDPLLMTLGAASRICKTLSVSESTGVFAVAVAHVGRTPLALKWLIWVLLMAWEPGEL